MEEKPQKRKVYGRHARLEEIRKAINRPDLLDDTAIDMLYSILYYA